MGLFWPIPEDGHPGTPRLFEGGRFYHPDGKARFHGVAFRESAEVVDDEYPIWLTTGRVVSQYLSGTQTRRIAGLVDQYPEPLCEMHPRLAEQLGVADGDRVTVTSRRGEMTLPASVVTTIRPDTVFIPYHWPGAKAANQLTNRALDPLAKMPEFKVAAVRVAPAGGRPSRRTPRPRPDRGRADYGIDDAPVFVIDQSRCIGCEACVQACMECGTHRGRSLIHLERVDRAATTQTAPMVCMHCEDPTCAQVCPADAIKQTEDGIVQSSLKPRCIGCSNCVLACPFGVPKYDRRDRPDDEVRHVLRPHVEGLKPMCASVCPSEALWYGTIEEFDETRRGRWCATSCSATRTCAPRCTPSSTTRARPLDVLGGARAIVARRPLRPRGGGDRERRPTPDRAGARLPLRGGRRGGGHPPRVRPLPGARRRRDGRRQRRHRRLDPAALDQHRRARPIVALADVAVGATTCSATRPTTTRRCCCASPTARRRVQPEVHPPRLRRVLPDRGGPLALPVPRGQLRGHAPAT